MIVIVRIHIKCFNKIFNGYENNKIENNKNPSLRSKWLWLQFCLFLSQFSINSKWQSSLKRASMAALRLSAHFYAHFYASIFRIYISVLHTIHRTLDLDEIGHLHMVGVCSLLLVPCAFLQFQYNWLQPLKLRFILTIKYEIRKLKLRISIFFSFPNSLVRSPHYISKNEFGSTSKWKLQCKTFAKK